MNPLGNRALYLGASTYRIHGTDAPWTIGQAVSKGCIRMFNEDVQQLYPQVKVGTKVTVTWQRFSATGAIAGTDHPPAPDATDKSGSATASATNDDVSRDDGNRKYGKVKIDSDRDSSSDATTGATSAEDQPYGGDGKPKKKTRYSAASGDDRATTTETTEKVMQKNSEEPKYSSGGPTKRYFIPYKKPLPAAKSAALDP